MATFIRSQRGAEKLIYEGYSYTKSKDGAQNKRHWRCDLWNITKGSCPATATTDSNNQVIIGTNEHNHEPSPTKIETALLKDRIKQAAIESPNGPKDIVDEQLRGISDEAKAILPKMVNLRKIVGRKRYTIGNSSSIEASFIKSRGNTEKLFYNGFVYNKFRDGTENRRFWRCEKWKKQKCRASAVTDENNQVMIKQCHNHGYKKETKINNRENIKKEEEIVNEEEEIDYFVGQIAGVSSQKRVSIPRSVKSKNPPIIADDENEKKYSNNTKKQQQQNETKKQLSSSFISKIEIPEQIWTRTTISENFILVDTGNNDDNRIIIFASMMDIARLASCDVWICDGTFFENCPQDYYFWVIQGRFLQSAVLPFVYALLPKKTKESYQRVFNLILSKIDEFNVGARPQTIIFDFEKEEEKALKSVLPNATIIGCFYFFKQAIWRKIVELGLHNKYQNEIEEEFIGHLKMFAALTFVDLADIRTYFRQLAIGFMKIYSDGDPDSPFAEFIDYMDRTWIGKDFMPSRFPLAIWNNKYIKIDQMPNASNSTEFWHRELTSIFNKHFSVPCNFIEALLDLQVKIANIAIRIESGESIQLFNREEHLRENESLLNLLNEGGRQWNHPMQYLTACSHFINFDF